MPAFLELVERPEFALALTRALAIQLQASRAVTLPSDPIPPVIAVVPLGEDVASGRFADELTKALGRLTKVKSLGEREAAEADSYGDALDHLERAGGQVVLPVEFSDGNGVEGLLPAPGGSGRGGRRRSHAATGPRSPASSGADLAMLGWPQSRRGARHMGPSARAAHRLPGPRR